MLQRVWQSERYIAVSERSSDDDGQKECNDRATHVAVEDGNEKEEARGDACANVATHGANACGSSKQ